MSCEHQHCDKQETHMIYTSSTMTHSTLFTYTLDIMHQHQCQNKAVW